MKEFLATSSKQLGICLKMLYAEGIGFQVKVIENNKAKINYVISTDIDDKTHERLREHYRILIS